jgi:hypothetical protein
LSRTSQFSLDAAVHPHPAAASIEICPRPPSGPNRWLGELTVNVHSDRPRWVNRTDWLATVRPASRFEDAGFDDAVRETVPGPVPVAPDVIVIQLASDCAVHEHCALVVTPTVTAPPCDSIVCVDGASWNVQAPGPGGVGAVGEESLQERVPNARKDEMIATAVV